MRKNQKEIQERMNNIIIKKENKILSIGDNVMMITCQDSRVIAGYPRITKTQVCVFFVGYF